MLELLDFWAPWCQPCKRLAPAIEELSREYKVTQINVDEDPDTAARWGVLSLPTVIILVDGDPVEQLTGSFTPQVLYAAVERASG